MWDGNEPEFKFGVGEDETSCKRVFVGGVVEGDGEAGEVEVEVFSEKDSGWRDVYPRMF